MGFKALALLGLIVPAATLSSCGGGGRRSEVTLFHAGSLSPLAAELAQRFESNHPGVKIHSESSGSLDAVRKIIELGKSCDLVATADEQLIELFLFPDYADRSYAFLGNEMVLATGRDDLLDTAEKRQRWRAGWYELLFSGGHSFGTSDPDRDPAGYYSRLLWKLAEIHYRRPGLYRTFLGRFQQRWLRPKSSELTALLQTGNLDFAFLYKSTALQNNLAFVQFPPEISLGEDSYADFYNQAYLSVAGDSPGSTFEVHGRPIRYGIARINRENRHAADFLQFWLSGEAAEIAREMGYTPVPVAENSVKGVSP